MWMLSVAFLLIWKRKGKGRDGEFAVCVWEEMSEQAKIKGYGKRDFLVYVFFFGDHQADFRSGETFFFLPVFFFGGFFVC